MKLSKNFSLQEFTKSQTALRQGIDNTPEGEHMEAAKKLFENVVQKVQSTGTDRILLTERGSSFGYNTLVTDFRSLPTMASTGYPVVMDATHSVQQPGGKGTSSGGQREFAPIMARAAVSLGIAAVFIETHQDPDSAPSDGANMIPLDQMPDIINSLMKFDKLAKENPCRV